MSNYMTQELPVVGDTGAVVARSLAALLVIPQARQNSQQMSSLEVVPLLTWVGGSEVSFADAWFGLFSPQVTPTLIAVSLYRDSPLETKQDWGVFHGSTFGRRPLSESAVANQFGGPELDEIQRQIPWGKVPPVVRREEMPTPFMYPVTKSAVEYPFSPELGVSKEAGAQMILPSPESESLRLRLASSLLGAFSRWIRFEVARRIGRPIR